jgi:hypothetical protein
VLSIKDIIEIAAIVMVGLGMIDAIRHDQTDNDMNQKIRESDSEPSDADKSQSKQRPIGLDPEETKRHCCKRDTENDRTKMFTLWLAFIAAAASAVSAWRAGDQVEVAINANKLNQESFASVQRAFITVTELSISAEYTQNPRGFFGWSFKPIIENSGATPTQNLRIVPLAATFTTAQIFDFNGKPIPRPGIELPAEPSDPDEAFIRHESPIRMLVGPHTKVTLPTTPDPRLAIPNGSIGWIVDGFASVFVFGSIHYFDVFENTPERVTRYCFRIDAKREAVTGDKEPTFSFCRFWNCADAECRADKTDYQKEAERLAVAARALPPVPPRTRN